MNSPYITTKELAEILPFSRAHIADRITHRRDFPEARRIGTRRLWKLDEVMKWIENRKESA